MKKEVLEKLYAKTHNVELGSIDDVGKKVTLLMDDILTAKATYSNAITAIRAKADKTINDYGKIQDELIKIEKQINDLGITAPPNFDKVAQEGYNTFVIAKRILQDVKDIK
jgi:hypothetical protein